MLWFSGKSITLFRRNLDVKASYLREHCPPLDWVLLLEELMELMSATYRKKGANRWLRYIP